jgi:hypothetical protein
MFARNAQRTSGLTHRWFDIKTTHKKGLRGKGVPVAKRVKAMPRSRSPKWSRSGLHRFLCNSPARLKAFSRIAIFSFEQSPVTGKYAPITPKSFRCQRHSQSDDDYAHSPNTEPRDEKNIPQTLIHHCCVLSWIRLCFSSCNERITTRSWLVLDVV